MTEMDSRLVESLTVLVPRGGGDWADVIARAGAIRSARRRRVVVTVVISLATLLVCAGTTLAIGSQYLGWFSASVSTSPDQASMLPGNAPYVLGQTLYRPHSEPQRLGHQLYAPLLYLSSALVIPSPDGRYIAYHASNWTGRAQGEPLLYIHDTITGRERLLARGAQTLAWGENGLIAYFKADQERFQQRFDENGYPTAWIGNVVVQTIDGPPTVWTQRSGLYEVLAWAGNELLVSVDVCYFPNCGSDPPAGVYVLSRSGQLRPLHLATLTALSPDGRYAFGGEQGESSRASIVRVDTGAVLTTVGLERLIGKRRTFYGRGSWQNGEIVTNGPGLFAFFRLRGLTLSLESVMRVPRRTLPGTWGPWSYAPQFLGPANEQVASVISGEGPGNLHRFAVLVCSRAQRHCVRGKFLPVRSGEGGAYSWFALVQNPSRPRAPQLNGSTPRHSEDRSSHGSEER